MASFRKVGGCCVQVHVQVLGPIRNNVYLISDGDTTAVVDPSCQVDDIMEMVGGRTVHTILLTHRHHDHVGAAKALRDRTGATVVASAIDAPWIRGERRAAGEPAVEPCPVDVTVDDGDVLKLGDMEWQVIGTPGHTPGSVCLYLDADHGPGGQGAPVLVSGDTLFCGSIGRTDFEGGDMGDMRRSLGKLSRLPDRTIVLPGHESLTTIGLERARVLERYA